jgi:CBS domain-containing protein
LGDDRVRPERQAGLRLFMRRILSDLLALERMIEAGMIEAGRRRIGAEQELFLVDRAWKPAGAALDLLERLDDPHYTTELGLFNLEINLDPLEFGGDCLRRLESRLDALVGRLRDVAAGQGIEIVLAGVLPTLRKADLGLENMTPKPRYHALNDAMNALRGGAYELHIKGLDELLLKHDSVMLEACNASFQIHFQAGAEEFANLYNIAQVVSAPVLAAAANSPLLFGRRLWRETRIALFQQSVDTRTSTDFVRERSPRVTFGTDWVRHSVLELFQEDLSRFKALVSSDAAADSLAELDAGQTPALDALRIYNGTVYRWNRACYGITGGRPHLRIENRVLPSGPSVVDEVANAAFWYGLISALSHRFDDITRMIRFENAKMNFRSAARLGLEARLVWLEDEALPATELIRDRLLPLAHDGLVARGIDSADAERYLSVIDERVAAGRNGAQWVEASIAAMHGRGSVAERLNALTAAMVERQKTGQPVSRWDLARLEEAGVRRSTLHAVEHYMTTDLFTVGEDEPLDLVANMMEWNEIRHVPVEDHEHRLVGMISYRCLIRMLARGMLGRNQAPIPVSQVMKRDLVTIAPEQSTLEAIELMRTHKVSCLPVVKDDRLVGILSERDLMNLAAELIEKQIGSQGG